MIIAGSVIALLLMGLAVDGFVNSEEEDTVEPGGDASNGDAQLDPSDRGTGLDDLLSANDIDDLDTGAINDLEGYVPLNDIALDDTEAEALALTWDDSVPEEEIASDEEEARADSLWASVAAATPDAGLIDISAMIESDAGDDVAYVDGFDPSTDTLVLEFDGTEEDTPNIRVEYSSADDAMLVFANDVPVTMVEGAEGMTEDNVSVTMSGEDLAQVPQVIPTSDAMDNAELDAEAPQPLSPPNEVDPRDPRLDEPIIEPTVFENRLVDGPDGIDTGPQTVPTNEGAGDLALEPTTSPTLSIDEIASRLTDVEEGADDGVLTPQTQVIDPDPVLPDTPDLDIPEVADVTDPVEDLIEPVEDIIDPVEDVIEPVEDLLPDDTTVNAILDQVTSSMVRAGGMDEMLTARVDMDDAFGTGGVDAQTGTFNNDWVMGGDGQDALFGDEGNDTLEAGAGNDELYGDTGHDNLQGAAGVDFLDGGEGNDTLDGGGDRDLLFGGDGDDVLYGGAANDFLQGGMGADTLDGGSGNDTLDGLFGDGSRDADGTDMLWGGEGDDQIILGQGDMANGGAGADTFVSGSYVESADLAGHVADFNPTEDRIEVIFDPQENPDPTLEVLDFADGTGADIILNGQVILSVSGAQGLDPNAIDLRAVA